MPGKRVLRVRVPEEVYWALVRRAGSPKRLSATVTELLKEALGLRDAEPSSANPPSLEAAEPERRVEGRSR
jgi:hypothetical protein